MNFTVVFAMANFRINFVKSWEGAMCVTSWVRGGIDTEEARIGQCNKSSEGVLVSPNLDKLNILVISDIIAIFTDVSQSANFGTRKTPGADFCSFYEGRGNPMPKNGSFSDFFILRRIPLRNS